MNGRFHQLEPEFPEVILGQQGQVRDPDVVQEKHICVFAELVPLQPALDVVVRHPAASPDCPAASLATKHALVGFRGYFGHDDGRRTQILDG